MNHPGARRLSHQPVATRSRAPRAGGTVTIAGTTFGEPMSFELGGKTYAKSDGTPWNQQDFDGILAGAAANHRAKLAKASAPAPTAEDALYDRLYGAGGVKAASTAAEDALYDRLYGTATIGGRQ